MDAALLHPLFHPQFSSPCLNSSLLGVEAAEEVEQAVEFGFVIAENGPAGLKGSGDVRAGRAAFEFALP